MKSGPEYEPNALLEGVEYRCIIRDGRTAGDERPFVMETSYSLIKNRVDFSFELKLSILRNKL